ncbi:tyrosine-type recombinase/integrase [Natronospira bacteriovora]|uniref:Tyrosine-type recombinase/integrase n=1 Tax=Natronospira bacteriovora TaxID=3069753 RepID=A0ABU0W4V9_9GAMM|nr:tyrosine-type recombinase/integrase [Natronospira sp. AB-CW4]MDQ2069056.1 tyrosine-type recombinase/integrase [Natronospira sp. AB-CW4]
MSRQTRITSITEAAASRHLKSAKKGESLYCKTIRGFHLLKTAKGGSWRVRYMIDGRRRVYAIGLLSEMKPIEAQERALEIRRKVDAGQDPAQEKKRQKQSLVAAEEADKARTVGAYLEGRYSDLMRNKRTGGETVARIRANFPKLMNRGMDTLNKFDIEAWQRAKRKEGRAHATLVRTYGALKTMLNQAVKDDLLDRNPLAHYSLEKPVNDPRERERHRKRKEARRLLTDDELEGLEVGLAAFAEEVRGQRRRSRKHGKPHLPDLDKVPFPHWFVPFCYSALYTGLRPGDLYSLTWQELSVEFGRLEKVPEKTKDHPNPITVKLKLPAEYVAIMRGWWEQGGKPLDGWVFPSRNPGEKMTKKAHLKPWARVKELGGLPADLGFYSLRHHFISRLVANGAPLLTIAQMVGHRSAQMIEQHYGNPDDELIAEHMEAFAKKLATPRKWQGTAAKG